VIDSFSIKNSILFLIFFGILEDVIKVEFDSLVNRKSY